MAHMRRTALAAALLLLAACGGSPAATPTTSTSGTATVTPAATASPAPPVATVCTSQIPAGHQLALVVLAKGSPVVVRDITDIAHPITRCTIYGGTFHRFVDATHVSYIVSETSGQSALYVVDLQTSHDTLIRAWTNQGSLYWVYAWSPDGKTLTYLSSNGDKVAWHVLSAAGDVTLSDLGSIPGRGANPNSDDAMVGFSADGKYVALEQTFSNAASAPGQAPFQVVRLSDHKLVYSRTDGTMATWAATGATLYYRTTSGVESWDATAGTRVVVPQGFRWIRPWPSADGKRIAYVDADSKGNHFPGYVQPSVGQAFRVSSRPRTGAVFLTPTLMWYAEEATCSGAVCGLGEPKLTGRTFIYEVVARTESASIITAFFDSWPHSA
jgi:hypothetical protein